MQLRSALSAFILICLSAASHAQSCGATSRPGFDFESAEIDLHNAVDEVEAGWQGKWKDLPLPERSRQQEAMIAKLNANHVERYAGPQRKANCAIGLAKTCASAPGIDHSCAIARTIAADREQLSVTLQNRPGDFPSGADDHHPVR